MRCRSRWSRASCAAAELAQNGLERGGERARGLGDEQRYAVAADPRRCASAYWWSAVAATQPVPAWSPLLAPEGAVGAVAALGDAEHLDDEVLLRVAHRELPAVGTRCGAALRSRAVAERRVRWVYLYAE